MTKKTEHPEEPGMVESDATSRVNKLLTSALAKKIIKTHGSTTLMRATESRLARNVPRISTGVFGLDYAFGGGVPKGMITTFIGQKSAGKTTQACRVLAEAQKVCADCCTGSYVLRTCSCGNFRESVVGFMDIEGTCDLKWAENVGVDTERLVFSRPDYGEQAVDITEALVRSGDLDVLVFDSLAFLVPMKEIENSVEQDMMGVQPRLIGRFIRKLVAALGAMEKEHGRRPTVIFTNQLRMKLGVMYGNPETTPGGMAPGFASACEVKMWPGKAHIPTQKEGGDGLGKPTSILVNYRVTKNKTAVPLVEGDFTMALAEFENKKLGDICDEADMVSKAEKIGVLTGSGSSYTMFGEKYKGKAELEEKLMWDPDFKKAIRDQLMAILLAA